MHGPFHHFSAHGFQAVSPQKVRDPNENQESGKGNQCDDLCIQTRLGPRCGLLEERHEVSALR